MLIVNNAFCFSRLRAFECEHDSREEIIYMSLAHMLNTYRQTDRLSVWDYPSTQF